MWSPAPSGKAPALMTRPRPGLMLHGFTYPDEDGSGRMSERLWQPVMRGGVVEFIRPEACPVVRPIRRQRVKRFAPGENLCPCGQLYQEVERDGMA